MDIIVIVVYVLALWFTFYCLYVWRFVFVTQEDQRERGGGADEFCAVAGRMFMCHGDGK